MKYLLSAILVFSLPSCEKRQRLDISFHQENEQTALSEHGKVEISKQIWRFRRYAWRWNRGVYRKGEYKEGIWVEGAYRATFTLEPGIELYDLSLAEKRRIASRYRLIFFDTEGSRITQSRHSFIQQWDVPGELSKPIDETFSIAVADVEKANTIDSVAVEFFVQ